MLHVEFDEKNGGVRALMLTEDDKRMNWVEGVATFGTPKGACLLSINKIEGGIVAVYETPHLRITARREMICEKYKESYTFENRLDSDAFIGRGELGIYATFNDSYENAKVCMGERCHTHLWCGGSTAYVKAVKMGVFPYGVALILTEGSLDSYSVERDLQKRSNDRGDFILHPSPFHLLPHGTATLSWEILPFPEDDFASVARAYALPIVHAEHHTVFLGEPIRFSVDAEYAEVLLNGERVPTEHRGGTVSVTYAPDRLGEHVFRIVCGGRESRAEFFVSLPFEELIHRRARFIVEHQQFHCEDSPLDGAYLIYDNEEKHVYFDELDSDRNASRERLMMGLFLAKYLQFYKDERIYESLMKYYRFVSREFYDEQTGAVYNAIRKNPSFKRLYNAPWMSVFVMEMYQLTGDESYLDKMFKLLCVYYEIGGEKFYPNGLSLYESIDVLRRAGKDEMADALLRAYQKHVAEIIKTGVYYPEHEVNYEQTIVTPAVTMIAQMHQLTDDDSLIAPCRAQLDILEKFNGDQPSYHLKEMSIRHWDGYWFGKRRTYGDTFPHPASIHTANAFLHYAHMSADARYKERAYECARNLLCLFRPDGSASNTYLYPYSVNGTRGEYYDDFANDQDGALYYLMNFYRLHEK